MINMSDSKSVNDQKPSGKSFLSEPPKTKSRKTKSRVVSDNTRAMYVAQPTPNPMATMSDSNSTHGQIPSGEIFSSVPASEKKSKQRPVILEDDDIDDVPHQIVKRSRRRIAHAPTVQPLGGPVIFTVPSSFTIPQSVMDVTLQSVSTGVDDVPELPEEMVFDAPMVNYDLLEDSVVRPRPLSDDETVTLDDNGTLEHVFVSTGDLLSGDLPTDDLPTDDLPTGLPLAFVPSDPDCCFGRVRSFSELEADDFVDPPHDPLAHLAEASFDNLAPIKYDPRTVAQNLALMMLLCGDVADICF
jgi:hypothetical protein